MDETPENKAPKPKAPARKRAASKSAAAKAVATPPKAAKPRATGTRTAAKQPAAVASPPAAAKKPARKPKSAAPKTTKRRSRKASAQSEQDIFPQVEFAQQQAPEPVVLPAPPPMPEPAEKPAPEPAPSSPPEVARPAARPHDEGLEFGLSPVDLAPDDAVNEDKGFGWFTRIMLTTSAMLVLFNSFAIDKWAREQPVTQWNSQVLVAAQQLHAGMKSMHLDAPLEGMRSIWHVVRDAQWPGSDSVKTVAEKAPAK